MLDELKCYIAQKKVIQIIHIITVLDFVIDIYQIFIGASPKPTHKKCPKMFPTLYNEF